MEVDQVCICYCVSAVFLKQIFISHQFLQENSDANSDEEEEKDVEDINDDLDDLEGEKEENYYFNIYKIN